MLGIWVGPSQPGKAADVVIIARGVGKRYRVSSPDPTPDPSGPTEADLVRIGKYEYLFPHTPELIGTVLDLAGRVQVSGRQLRISVLNGRELMEELKPHPEFLAHRKQPAPIVGSTSPATQPASVNLVLTDAPEKIRQVLIEHEDDPHWFTEVLVLNRVTPPIRR